MVLSLIGLRGTGKTTIARALAGSLGWNWLDADSEIEARAGKSIAAIFAEDGEPAFRDLEAEVIREACTRSACVLATGGGAVLRESNRQALKKAGPVVYLTADLPTMLARISADATTAARRPALTAYGQEQEIRELLAVRAPLYAECATLTVDTSGKTPEAIVREILDRLNMAPSTTEVE